jgi:arabinogalactan endo-1,4-beta-galactosidase
MKKSFLKTILLAALCVFSLDACSDDNNTTPQQEKQYDMTGFAKGADVSWLTEMESSGTKFYNAAGSEQECMTLLRDLGMNSIRLRVWVNPSDGWCNKQDVLVKAWRAKNLGMRVMIDFHYSDSWADPSKQTTPSAWADYDLEALKTAVADHTTDVLETLKAQGIDVEWIQIGNETSTGMLWPTGLVSGNDFTNYVALNNAGYEAAKAVYPEALCIVHIDRAQQLSHLTWMFNGLRDNGAKWDVIGLSFYPTDDDWQTSTESCLANMKTLATTYGKKVMLCEIGMNWESENAETMLSTVLKGCKAMDSCLGVFYWEPECYSGWNGYAMGAFDGNGKPTSALNAFSE